MNPTKFAALPVGSVVTHKVSERSCAYRKHADGGWQVAGLEAPHPLRARPTDTFRVDLQDGSDCTLVVKGQTAKDLRIGELVAQVADLQRALDTEVSAANLLRAKEAELRAEIARLRNVIRAARGTLGNNF